MVHPRSGSRRYQRDRTAQQVVWLVVTISGLLAIGGIGWLMQAPAWMDGRTGLMAVEEESPVADELAQITPPALVMLPQPSVDVETIVSPIIAPEPEQPASPPVVRDLKPAKHQPSFDGRPLKPIKTMRMLVTAYSPDARSCGKWAQYKTTASGYSVYTNGMCLAAADRRLLPFGTVITVPGYHDARPIPVLDVGGAIKGNRLDVLFPTHEQARKWGQKWLTVTVWGYADK